jgi:hypothetical protein
MRKKVRLILLAASVVFLSGTAILYLAGAGAETRYEALARPDPVDCEADEFCGANVGNAGCAARDCCPQGTTYCYIEPTRTPLDFPKIVPRSEGGCYKKGTEIPWCQERNCVGAVHCSEQTCRVDENQLPTVVKKTVWEPTGVPCPDRRY